MGTCQSIDDLKQWCIETRIGWHDLAFRRFEQYIALLLKYQQRTNLTGFETAEAMIQNGFVDSLQLLRVRLERLSGPVLDIGSGAGLPALPIKILYPDIEMHLVEPRSKRYAFLGLVIRELGLENITVHHCRVESLELKKTPALVISKALMPFPEWLKLTEPWRKAGAEIGCYLSARDWDEHQDLIDAFAKDGGALDLIKDGDRYYIIFNQIIGRDVS